MSDDEKPPLEAWVEERHRGSMRLGFRLSKTLFSEKTPYQQIDVVECTDFGRMLFNDSVVMISERDEWIYHEMIAHVPLFVLPAVERVLVIGGGDGGTVREVLRHPGVRHVRLVEIDRAVVDACRAHIPQTAAALDDERVSVTIADAARWVRETDDRYDLVLVDSSDPIGPATPLFGPEFYAQVHRILTDRGVVVSQAESPYFEMDAQLSLLRILGQQFRTTRLYNYTNMTYPGGLWSFSYASKGSSCPLRDFDPQRVAASGLEFRYYSAEIHSAAFTLPAFQAARVRPILSGIDG